MERRGHIENLLAMLNGDDAASRETAAIARPIDFIDDRNRRIARAQEISVQGMTGAGLRIDRPISGNERLRDHLPPKHALIGFVLGALPAKQVNLKPLEVHEMEQITNRVRHFGAPFRNYVAAQRVTGMPDTGNVGTRNLGVE